MKKHFIWLTVLLGFICCATFAEDKTSAEKEPESSQQESYWEKTKNYYNELTEKGIDKTGEDAKTWVKEDLEKIGDWEYKIVIVKENNLEKLQNRLNEFGSARWECYWQETGKEGRLFFFKRKKISYLQRIPIGNLLRSYQGNQ
jgi:hypothetical protein